MRGQNSAVFLVFLLLLSSLSLVLSHSNQGINESLLSEQDSSYEVILPIGQLNIPGFQEGSIYTNSTLSSGSNHTCAILDDRSVSCWGDNIYGQLGDGTTNDRRTPTQTSSLGTGRVAVAISSGSDHTCALLDDGSVSCWGDNTGGQLGDGTTTDRSTPTQTSNLGIGMTAVAISSGDYHTCALLDNGYVSCWGYNGFGGLGDGTTTNRSTPTQTTSLGTGRTAVAISSGDYHTCAILDDASVNCWGENNYGQLGDGTTTQRNTPTQTSSLGAGRTVVAISSGDEHTCAVLDDASVSCWGHNSLGQLGDGTNTNRGIPTQTSSLGTNRGAVAISSGGIHTCALLDNESVSCWGWGYLGQLGDGTNTNRNTPTQISSLGTGRAAVAISSGRYHACAILDDGSVSCWGDNLNGQLGDGTITRRNIPTPTSSLGTIQNPRTVALSERDLDDDGILNIFDSTPNGDTSNPTPQWTTVSPSFGPSSGGTDLTITGSGFSSLIDNFTLPENPPAESIRSWTNTTVDSNVKVGSHSSIAVDSNDYLHISYFGAHNSDLKYATYDGSSWTESLIDTGVDVGEYTSIAVDSNDNVHISYYDSSNADLKYATYDGNSWAKLTVDNTGSVGEYTSIAVDSNDDLHITYYDFSNEDLKYTTYNGSSWTTSTVDSTGSVGQHSSIGVDSNDDLHISYYDYSNGDLKYASYDGISWSNSAIDSTGDVGLYSSIAIDSNDDVHISYLNSSVGNIKYATFDGSNWATSQIYGAGSVGDYGSLAVDSNGNVHVSFFDYSNSDLKYSTFEQDGNGNGWTTSTVDSEDDVGFFTSIAIDSNNDVHISYFDTSNENLKYAKLSENNSSVSANEITIQFEAYGNVTGTVASDSIITVTSPPGLVGGTVDLTLWPVNGNEYVLASVFTYLQDSDTDSDGIINVLDDCPNYAGNSTIDQIGCPDADGDGYSDSGDTFPSNPGEWGDSDADGVGDNSDEYPLDSNETSDSDGDGVGDNADEFPNNGNETIDSDEDGVGDNADVFPNDGNETIDSDEDGIGDNGDEFPFLNNFKDSDNDSIFDLYDDFPYDSSQWSDYDGDGFGDLLVGNNSDAFINNATQWSDTDGDGYGDNWGNSTWNTTRLFIWPGQFIEGAEIADHCPTEFGNSTVDGYFGCLDIDGDGIADLYDSLIENESQHQSNDTNVTGALDSDGDGVEDLFDVCPSTVVDGYVDIDGCLLDQDGDGVDDLKDTCPDTSAHVSVNVNGCAIQYEEVSFMDSLRSGNQGAVLQTAGFGAIIIALLGFLQTNFMAALLPDSFRWLRVMRGNSKLNKEELQELTFLQSLVQAYYLDSDSLTEELHQLKSDMTARYTNNEIKKETREKMNTLISDLLDMESDEISRIAHNDAYFGLVGTIDTKQRSEFLSQELAMRFDVPGNDFESKGINENALQEHSIPAKVVKGEINPADDHEYLESPIGSNIWYIRDSNTGEWNRWDN